MLSKFYKTTSAFWLRTLDIQKGSPFSIKKKRKRDKKVRDRDLSQGWSREGGEVSKHQETLSSVGLWGVLESQSAT